MASLQTFLRRRQLLLLVALAALAPIAYFALRRPFPSDQTPEGAYLRIARAVNEGRPAGAFAYLEDEAQWASYTIRDTRKKALELVRRSYPEARRDELVRHYEALGEAPDGSDAFAILYETRGWSRRLRRDLSGVASVELAGDRASVVTARGTRWPFRRRANGIWGLTVFTAELVAEAEKATRDLAVVEAAAADYERAKAAGTGASGLTMP